MESSSKPRRFRFRDHTIPESQNSMHSSEPSSDVSAVSLPINERDNDEPDIESMTARGIKHLCDELLELKEAASEDLQKTIFANYSSFLRILDEVAGVENELVQLENQFVSHKRLVRDLIDHIYPKIQSISSNFENHIYDESPSPSPPSEFEAHINDVSEKLDFLMWENKIDEAIELLESAEAHYQGIQHEDYSNDEINLYSNVISDKKFMIKQRLIEISENNRTIGPELQKAISGLCRIGETEVAINFLLKYYHLRISNGTSNLQWSRSSSDEIYIKELARFVFSMISQAARSFVMLLCGDSSPYTSELIMWAREETNSFVNSFDKHVKTISASSGGLSSAIKSVKFSVLYCSLLENQNLVLRPYLVRKLCPCMEEVLNTHVNHFKKVIGIFSASDSWVLEKYLVSGVFDGGSLTIDVGEQPEYCLLTTSGRKFLTLLQAIVEDISPLVSLQMGSSVISGLKNLFTEYTTILRRALTYESRGTEQVSPRIKLAESVPQQVSVLANMSTLVNFLSVMVKNIYSSSNDHMDSHEIENNSVVDQKRELDDFLLFIEESSNKLRNLFCQQLILKVFSTYNSQEIFSAIQNHDQGDDNTIHNTMPSAIFQVLFLELRKIERLDEENVFEVNWLMGLQKDLMESMFIWVSNNKEIYSTTEENMSSQDEESNQFVLDVQFLVEIGIHGGYFSNDPLLLITLMKSAFNSAGLDPFKDEDNDGWAIDAATKTVQKLLEIEKTLLQQKDPILNTDEDFHDNQSTYLSEEGDINSSDNNSDAVDSEEEEVPKDESEVAIDAETSSQDIAFSPQERSSENRTSDMKEPSISAMEVENNECEKGADAEHYELAPTSPIGEVGHSSEKNKSKSDE